MEQRHPAGEIFVDDRIGRARHRLLDAQPRGKTPDERRFSCTQAAVKGDKLAWLQPRAKGTAQLLRLPGRVGRIIHNSAPICLPGRKKRAAAVAL